MNNKSSIGKYFIITDLFFADYMKDKEGNTCLYDTIDEAFSVCGMYEFENALICQVHAEHIEDELTNSTVMIQRVKDQARINGNQWVYQKVYMDSDFPDRREAKLKELGELGWELTSIRISEDFYFKKRVDRSQEPLLEVSDVRNKLSPVTTLISILEMIDDNDLPTKEREYIWKAIEESKKSINYLAQRNVYDSISN